MDWTLAIDRNRDALMRVLAMLFAVAGIAPGGSVATLPKHMHCAVLRLLRPAESAARRLIFIVAHITGTEGLSAPRPVRSVSGKASRRSGARVASFPILDPRLRVGPPAPLRPAGTGPRIGVPGLYDPVFPTAVPSLPPSDMDAGRLCRRLAALQRVLEDVPGQARRLARWQARSNQLPAPRKRPLRPGRPPGFRRQARHPVDEILRECHELALYALRPPDTS